MRVCADAKRNKARIISSIRKFGYSPEHNYHHHLYRETPDKKFIFFDFGKRRGVLAIYNKKNNVWYLTSEILAPPDERLGIFLECIEYMLRKKKARKVSVEAGEEFKSKVFKRLKNSKYKLSACYILYWPVYNLKGWSLKLRGKQWKKLRNIRNRFYSRSNLKTLGPGGVSRDSLRKILKLWLKRRNSRDAVDKYYYLNIINNNFKGFDSSRVISIDGEPCSFSAGWQVPNSNIFYCGVGIFNYKHKDLGDFVNLDDLIYLKKAGYKCVDLGGSDKALLRFKKKLRPERIYKTYTFYISRKK